MKNISDKCHLIVSTNDIAKIQIQLKTAAVKSCWVLTLTLNLILIVNQLYSKANKNVSALARVNITKVDNSWVIQVKI